MARKNAYTLIEVLVVAVVVVLMLGMALPVFRAITGSRSEAGASNIIASMLGRARTDAIGLQKPIGVAFVYDPTAQLSYMAEVEFPDSPSWFTGQLVPPLGYVSAVYGGWTYYYINNGTYTDPSTSSTTVKLLVQPASYSTNPQPGIVAVGGPPLEIRPGTELLPLPTGIGAQTICNCNFSTSSPYPRISNGYLSFGVILFDGSGRVASQNYGASRYSKLMTSLHVATDYPVTNQNIHNGNQTGVASQYGVVVFQQEAYLGQRSPTQPEALYTDPTPALPSTPLPSYSTGSPTQLTEENWLDQNATPLLIDRYTGTLIRGE